MSVFRKTMDHPTSQGHVEGRVILVTLETSSANCHSLTPLTARLIGWVGVVLLFISRPLKAWSAELNAF